MQSDPGFWDRIADKYARSSIADPAGYERTLERVRAHLRSEDVVLEFGCGTGATVIRLADCVARITATDVSPRMIEIARRRASDENCSNVRFSVAGVEEAPAETAFDAVFTFNLLHLVGDPQAAIRAANRALKPGGLFFSKTPCLKDAGLLLRMAVKPAQLIGKAPYLSFFSADELKQAILDSGFEIVETGYHGSKGRDFRPFMVARNIGAASDM